jgi:hypothetical protein
MTPGTRTLSPNCLCAPVTIIFCIFTNKAAPTASRAMKSAKAAAPPEAQTSSTCCAGAGGKNQRDDPGGC